MKRFLAALVVAFAVFAATSCNDYNNTIQGNTGAVLTFLAPADAFAGGSAFTLTVNGGGFVAQTVVQWNGQNRATTPVKNSSGAIVALTAAISAADIAKAGTAYVNTLNPHHGGTDNGLSNALAFIINPSGNPVPSITSISPASIAPASAAFSLTISGSNFLPPTSPADPTTGSVVHWNAGPSQSALVITAMSSTQITATVPASLVAAAGSAVVSVFNPPPGGGGSNGVTFTIGSGPVAGLSPQGAAEDSPAVSADGRYVSYAAGEGSSVQIFVRDTCTGANMNCEPRTVLVSAAPDETPGNADSQSPSISADARYIAFSSAATNLAADAPPGRQIYLRDTCFGAATSCKPSTQLISTDPNGALGGSENILPSVSSSGRFVAFLSVTPSRSNGRDATKMAGAPNSGYRQVFVRDTCLGAVNCTPSTTRISLQPGDAPASGPPARPTLSGSASHVALAGNDATLFTRGAAIDDRIFLALTGNPR